MSQLVAIVSIFLFIIAVILFPKFWPKNSIGSLWAHLDQKYKVPETPHDLKYYLSVVGALDKTQSDFERMSCYSLAKDSDNLYMRPVWFWRKSLPSYVIPTKDIEHIKVTEQPSGAIKLFRSCYDEFRFHEEHDGYLLFKSKDYAKVFGGNDT